MDVSLADNCQNLSISNPKPELHNNNAHTKYGENPLMCTQVITQKQNMDRRMYGPTEGHTDVQSETIILCHYRVAGYKNALSGTTDVQESCHSGNSNKYPQYVKAQK